jgi:hypothetical protein
MNEEELKQWKDDFIRIIHQRFGVDLQTSRCECESYMESNAGDLSDPSDAVDECAQAWCDSM